MPRAVLVFAVATWIAACGGDAGPDLAVEKPGPFPVGTRSTTVTDTARSRDLTVQVWYPAISDAAAAAATGFPIEELETEPRRATYAGLLAAADPRCPTRTVHAARDVDVAAGLFPLLLFSHCHECTRFSATTIAERLASHGFIVVAVDHTGNTLWDQLAGTGLPLDATTLELRAGDLEHVLARVRSGSLFVGVDASADVSKVGVFGHSFGAVTAGLVAQRNALGAAFALAAPMENPLLPGVSIAAIDEPLGFLLAKEDNSITELGNSLIRSNFTAAHGGAWKLEVDDLGHWGVSDVDGVVAGFAAGCGEGTRQTDGQPFTYLDPNRGRALAAAHVTAFFKATLEDDAGARGYLEAGRPEDVVTVEHH